MVGELHGEDDGDDADGVGDDVVAVVLRVGLGDDQRRRRATRQW